MAVPTTNLPPVRATIFDMDGLLIDSEDAYTRVTNTILHEHGRPDLPWAIKAQLQGRPGPAAGKIFHEWAKLDITQEEFMTRQKELQKIEFTKCRPLPGVERLLANLHNATTASRDDGRQTKRPIHMAVATSSHRANFDIKTKPMKSLFHVFPESQIIVGDDDRVPRGRGKPLPDIYLLALEVLNQQLALIQDDDSITEKEPPIKPEECLVFEDSVPGVEAGRRAGMRVVWCPHPGLLGIYRDRVDEVLAGQTGEHKESDLDHQSGIPLAGSPGEVGTIGDGWAEILDSLEHFDYTRYGIAVGATPEASNMADVVRQDKGQSGRPLTDKDLEEITARADGKLHAPEEGTSAQTSPTPGLQEMNPKV